MFSERRLELTDRTLRLFSGPANGPPLLLLHGVSRCGMDFVQVLPHLSARWTVHALDFRGHGGSDRCRRKYRVIEYLDDATAVMSTMAEPWVVMGHSLGALVAAATAATARDRVRAIVLEDPPAAELLRHIRGTPFHALFQGMQLLAGDAAPVPEIARQLAAMPLPGPGAATVRLGDSRDPASLRFLARCLKDVDPAVYDPLIAGRWLDGFDVEGIMRGIKCPALLLRGDEALGGMLSFSEARQWADWMADCTLVNVAGVGHQMHALQTDNFVRLVMNFLESLR